MGPLILVLWLLAQTHAHQVLVKPAAVTDDHPQPTLETLAENRSSIDIPAVAPTPYLSQKSMLSVYAGNHSKVQETELRVRCKTGRSVSNIDVYIPIFGVVQDDVVSAAGKILVPVGSKVFGQGYCDAEHGRLLSRGRWIFYLSDHQIGIQGTLWDASHVEGLAGEEISKGFDENRVKQAIYRDGIYLYVPSETEFTLRLRGEISVEDLPSAYGK